MSIAKIVATIRCDGCMKPFEVPLDPAQPMKLSGYDTIDDFVEWMIRAGDTFAFSVQGDHQLCAKCTKIVDDAFPDDEDATTGLTHDEVARALNKAAGV